ncbi:putative ankyrin repeat protein [Amylocarpus encephaloides]|uniref:Ankyrin repeat protein n=1 Tax=Amylocarpus encephaloides TaxID=45428 RepID=A0A9P8C5S8_9HELO|nr:putative ankyrin repeat protein [Amylocarpus encephaloides]
MSPEHAAENHSIIEVLLEAGAEGSEVDALLHVSVTSSRKSRDLIELLAQNHGTVSNAVLLSAVSQGAVEIVHVLLKGNVALNSCLVALPSAMKLPVPAVRFEIVKALLGLIGSSPQENIAITQAVIDTLTHSSHDLQLLRLLCQAGKANINLCDGQAVILATNLQNLKALDIVLCSQGCQPNVATVRCGLNCAIALPLFDPSRPMKVERLLQGIKPQTVIDDSLVKEVRFLVAQKHKPDVLRALLAAGASINANEGASIRLAVPNPATMDIILSRTPSVENLSFAFMEAVKLSDPARSNMCQKLLQAGAIGEEINKGLCVAASEGAAGLVFLKLLIPHGDVNYKGGQALYYVVKQTCLEALDVLLSRRAIMPSAATMRRAFWEGIDITDKDSRLIFIKRLLMAQIPVEAISEALATAASDPGLLELLLQFGASVEHSGGQAILCATRLGQTYVLEMLVQGKYGPKPSQSTLLYAFSAASSLKEKNAGTYHSIIQILLEAGARGDPLAIALVDAVMDGDKNLSLIELLCNHEASVEWDGGSAINIAARTAATQALKAITVRQPSHVALTRAYKSAMMLPKGQRFRVIEILLKAGKSIDENVSQTLTMAACESPPDRQLVGFLIGHHSYDNGESMIHAGVSLDLETLRLLAQSSEAVPHITYAFNNVIRTDVVWASQEGLSVLEFLLKHGATGDAVSEALCLAVEKLDVTKDVDFIRVLIDMFLGYGADVNYRKGMVLQRATSRTRLDIVRKLLPSATSTTKAMALPHLFPPRCDMKTVLDIIQAFNSSLPDVEKDFLSRFQHTDLQLEPILFSALDAFPRKLEPLRALLDIGYSPNQWRPYEVTTSEEMWPVLCWALQQPEKRVSDSNIETLIDSGAHINFRSKSGITPLLLAIQGRRIEIISKLIAKGAKVSVGDENGVTPLALASRSGNLAIMEILLREYPEINDGSLHDAASQLQCDTMRILIKHGHEVDYPSDRHDGRSALAELCLNAVSQNPSAMDLEDGVSCLVANDADTQLRCVSEDRLEKTILHFALDSTNPLAILSVLLKLMWRKINDDAFLYHAETFAYSLTKYVEKDIFRGPRDQKVEILRVLRNKRATDRFWVSDIESEQPSDYCNPPAAIAEEILRQKLRRKRVSEQREEVMAQLDLKRLSTLKEVELLEIRTQAEIQQAREKAENEQNLLTQREDTKLQLETHAESERQRMLGYHQARELNHVRNMGDVQLANRRKLTLEAVSEDQQRQQLQLGYMDSKVSKENDGLRARLAIEGSARHEDESFDKRRHERDIARMKMQKSLIESNAALAGSLQGAGMNQRQIGYITGELK